jgi:predicted small secreted protein
MSARVLENERTFRQKLMHWLAVLAIAAMPLALNACNTMEGAGEDIEEAGESLQDAAD